MQNAQISYMTMLKMHLSNELKYLGVQLIFWSTSDSGVAKEFRKTKGFKGRINTELAWKHPYVARFNLPKLYNNPTNYHQLAKSPLVHWSPSLDHMKLLARNTEVPLLHTEFDRESFLNILFLKKYLAFFDTEAIKDSYKTNNSGAISQVDYGLLVLVEHDNIHSFRQFLFPLKGDMDLYSRMAQSSMTKFLQSDRVVTNPTTGL